MSGTGYPRADLYSTRMLDFAEGVVSDRSHSKLIKDGESTKVSMAEYCGPQAGIRLRFPSSCRRPDAAKRNQGGHLQRDDLRRFVPSAWTQDPVLAQEDGEVVAPPQELVQSGLFGLRLSGIPVSKHIAQLGKAMDESNL